MISKLIIPGALLAAAIALFFGMTQPLMMRIKDIEASNKNLTQSQNDIKELKRVDADLNTDYNKVSEDNRKRLEQLLPDNVDNVKMIIDINKLASDYNMPLRNIKVNTDEAVSGGRLGPNTKKYGTVTIGFTVAGSYTSLRSFLEQLETSLRMIDVKSLSFTASDKDSNEYSFEIKTYWLKKPKAL